MRSGYEKLIASIIRPPRVTYETSDLRCRPVDGLVSREDFQVINRRGEVLECSKWINENDAALVVYLHSNSSCRLAVTKSPVLETVMRAKCSLIAFDFSGCGLSEGDFVTLGVKEKDDVKSVVEASGYDRVILWGRSMGAVSALLYSEENEVAGLVLDSPFSSMRQLVRDVSKRTEILPSCCVGCVSWHLNRSTKRRTRCDIFKVDAVEAAKKLDDTRALFLAADEDALAPIETHSQKLADVAPHSTLFTFHGEHNSPRPHHVYKAVLAFLKSLLKEEKNSPLTLLTSK